MSIINTDKLSTWMGAPPHHWKPNEAEQIKQIQRCYRNAYAVKGELQDVVKMRDNDATEDVLKFGDNMNMDLKVIEKHHRNPRKEIENEDDNVDDGIKGKRDEEDFLPMDSPLRSKNGDKKAPMNPVFKDYEAFVNSCSFDYWRNHFEQSAQDKFMSETAATIVANICSAQARHEMRVHNGHMPLRKKREHITPLALVLHEIKLWATHELRIANVVNEDTYQELRCRILYLESLAHKEVWGDAAVVFGQGMRSVSHDKLFRLLLSSKEALTRAEEYAYRGYSRRCSREKLHRVKNLLKDLVLNEMRMLSARMTLEEKLQDPKTSRLQPTDLLNSIENQTFVDYKNYVNVMLYKLCVNPMVRATLTGDYDKPEVKEVIDEISEWSNHNLFCVPNIETSEDGTTVKDPNPVFRMDKKRETRIMPEVYAPTAAELKRMIRDVDPKGVIPDSAKRVIARLGNAYESIESSAKVIRTVMKNAAAIQDLVPTIYAMHELWVLAGEGGDFTVYDTMRSEVIRVMQDCVTRVTTLRKSGKMLNIEINRLCELKEETMKKDALRNRKMKYKPAWVMNHKFINTELLVANEKNFDTTLARLFEIAKDARDYELTAEDLSDKVKTAKKVFDAITGYAGNSDEIEVEESYEAKSSNNGKKNKKNKNAYDEDAQPPMMKASSSKDWLQADNDNYQFAADDFATNSVAGSFNYGKYDAVKEDDEDEY